MSSHTRTYWIFQITGWALYCLIYIFFYLSIRIAPQPYFFEQLLTHVFIGFWLTHVMRMVIQRMEILQFELKKQIIALTILSLVFSFFIGVCIVTTEIGLGIQSENLIGEPFLNVSVRFAFSYFHFVLIWNLLYFTYHYVQKTRLQNIEQAKLENLLKELEITTIKAHINPQFLFSGLNSIRSLVTEDPARARTAITMLSNILRSSIQIDKAEKTLFEKELSIIKDYISMEQIRLADQLHATYTIEEDTLDQPVPAMVLQILVENAIKYGKGETTTDHIEVYSEYKEELHCFGVISSGSLQAYQENELESLNEIRKRIFMLYGKKANLRVENNAQGLIVAAVCLPL
jgi:two-component system, LytTR family, sensor kinase